VRLNGVEVLGTLPPTGDRPAAPIHLLALRSTVAAVEVVTLGAALHRVRVPDRHGVPGDVHLLAPDLSVRLRRAGNPYLGATVGRYANRIAGARLVLDGRPVQLEPNEGPNQLHGGPEGFHLRVWTVVDRRAGPDGGQLTLAHTSVDGDQGFPGTLRAEVTYRLEGPVLTIAHRATTDAATVVNLCNHAYWNLDGEATVSDHRLAVAAERYLPVDGAGIPSGGLEPVAGTPFDLRGSPRVGEVVAATGGLDHSYAVGGAPDAVTPAPVAPVAWLAGPRSGRVLEVRTDRAALQVYAGAHLDAPFAPFAGICLEAQAFPDTPNRSDLGSVELRPGEIARSTTELHFGLIGG
jgi:aldose 1-epimerase